jgi:hypothetical protein
MTRRAAAPRTARTSAGGSDRAVITGKGDRRVCLMEFDERMGSSPECVARRCASGTPAGGYEIFSDFEGKFQEASGKETKIRETWISEISSACMKIHGKTL